MSLFTTQQELAKYGPVTENFDMDAFGTHIRRADRTFIYPAVSRDLYDYIRAAAAAESLTTLEAEACELLKEAEAVLAFYKWIVKGQVNISSAGIRIANTEGWKTAFQWQIRDLQTECLHDGLAALEELIVLLNANLSVFSIYRDSDQYTENYNGFLNSGKEFNEYFTLAYPRYTFILTNAIRRRVERDSIWPIIGEGLANEIITQINAQELSVTNAKIIGFIRGAIANLTIARAIIELSVQVSEKGITVYADSGTTGTIDKREPVSDVRLAELRRASESTGAEYLSKLRTFLQDNPTDYPLYTPVDTAAAFERKDDDAAFAAFT